MNVPTSTPRFPTNRNAHNASLAAFTRRKGTRISLAAAVAAVLATQSASAVILTWNDADSKNSWDLTAGTNWLGGAAWSNTTPDEAIFAGPGEAITLGAAITAAGLTFNSGGYTLSGGTLTTPTITTIAGTTTISSVIAGSAGLTKAGTGTLVLNGSAANTFTGGLNVNGGALTLDFANLATPTNLIDTSNALTLGGGTLNITAKTGAGVTTTQTLGNVTVNAGGGAILIDPKNSGGATLNLGTLTATAPGSSLLLGKAVASTGTVTIMTTSNKDAQGIYGGRIVFANGTANTGYDWATSSGSSLYTLSAYSSYAALTLTGTDTSNSRLSHSGGAAITTTLTGTRTTNSLKIENIATGGAQSLALGTFDLTLSNGGLLSTGTRAETISGTGKLTAGNGSGAYELIIHQYNSGGLTISAPIGDNGGSNSTGLTKAGTGTLTLSGTNTYTGGTTLNAGTLSLGSSGALSSSGTISFGGGTLQYSASNTTDYSARFSTADGQQYRVDTGSQPVTWGTALTSVGGSLTKTGGAQNTGILTLSGTAANTYTGLTTIDNGAILASKSADIVAIPGDITFNNANFSTLRFAANGQLGGSGIVTFQGTAGSHGRFMLEGTTQSIAGIVNNGTASGVVQNAETGNGGSTGNAGTGTLTLTGSGTYSFAGFMRDGAGAAAFGKLALTKNGTGTQTLSGSNITYTGATTINDGRLVLQNTTGFASATTINGGILEANASTAATSWNLTPALSGAGNVEKSGPGTVVLKGTNTNTGTITVSNGTLQFGLTASLNVPLWTASKLIVNSGATAAFNVGGTNEFTATDIAALNAVGSATGGFMNGSFLGLDTTNAGGNFPYASAITDTNGGANSLGLVKLGTGTLTLTATNTYTGATAINAGTVQFTKAASLYGSTPGSVSSNQAIAAANFVVNSGATAAFNVGGAAGFTLADIGYLAGLGTATTGFKSGSTLALDTSGAGGSFTLSSAIGDTNAGANVLKVTKLGAGTLVLSGSNSYTGGTTVTGGTLALSGAGTLGSTTSGLTMSGGVLDLGTTNQTVGAVTISGSNTIQATGAGTSQGAFTASSVNLGTVSSSLSASATVTNNGALSLLRSTLNVSGTWNQAGGLTVSIDSNTFNSSFLNINAGGLFNYTGGNTISLNGNNKQGGQAKLTISGGTFVTNAGFKNNSDNSSGGPSVGPGVIILQSGGTLKLTADVPILLTGKVIGGGTSPTLFQLNGGAGIIDTNGDNTALGHSTTITQGITGAGSLTKEGLGTLTLSGANTYAGQTTVSGGTLEVTGSISGSSQIAVQNSGSLLLGGTSADRIGNSTSVTLGGGTGSDAKLQLADSGITESVGALTLASNSVLDFGNATSGSIFHFGDSDTKNWGSFTLSIWNWSPSQGDKLYFDSSDTALTTGQLSSITFYSGAGTGWLGTAAFVSGGNGELTAVPEPSTIVSGLAMLGYVFLHRRRTGRWSAMDRRNNS